jgi:hypothetical protein
MGGTQSFAHPDIKRREVRFESICPIMVAAIDILRVRGDAVSAAAQGGANGGAVAAVASAEPEVLTDHRVPIRASKASEVLVRGELCCASRAEARHSKLNELFTLVGAARFELTTPCAQGR